MRCTGTAWSHCCSAASINAWQWTRQLRDAVDFAVDSAAVDLLAVLEGASYRALAQLIAVAASADQVRPLIEQAADAGTPWQAIDIIETALRNLGALVEPEGRVQALLHCQARHATLVVTYGGELLSTRQMELTLVLPDDADAATRSQAYDHAVLELQRTLDGIERAFGQVTLARLLITPMTGVQALCDHLAPLLYVPVAPLQLDAVLDFSAVPDLLTDYLRSLNGEPRFKGRPFAQLSLKSVDSSGASTPFTEFALGSATALGSAIISNPP